MELPYDQITIDGPAASGKSTVSRKVAAALRGFYVNSGNLYRAIAWLGLKNNIDINLDQRSLLELITNYKLDFQKDEKVNSTELVLCLNGKSIDCSILRTPEVTQKVSLVAKIPEIRSQIIAVQRNVKSLGLIVMDGRDIGTVIFPNAKYKFFLTASPTERARRRLGQSPEIPDKATLQSVEEEILKRDEIDSNREVAPLKPAIDAIRVETTTLTVDQVVNTILAHVHDRNSSNP